MSGIDDLNSKREAILSIPSENVKNPSMPVDTFLQEVENMIKWSVSDLPELQAVGITQEVLDDMNVSEGACREAQSLWIKDFRERKEAQKQWNAESLVAYDLRDELIHTFRFAYRDDEHLSKRISAIAEGSSHADMIQDLNDLAVLGRSNISQLSEIGFDLTKLDMAAEKADYLAGVLALANGKREESNEAKELRDRAYTYLKEQFDHLRRCGKYIYWKNPERLKGYTSEFWRRKNSKRTNDEDQDVTE